MPRYTVLVAFSIEAENKIVAEDYVINNLIYDSGETDPNYLESEIRDIIEWQE